MIVQISSRRIKQCAGALVIILILWLTLGHVVILRISDGNREDGLSFFLTFLAPMNREGVLAGLDIRSVHSGDGAVYRARWLSPFKLLITIPEEDYPRGLGYTYRLDKAPALIPPFSVTARGYVEHHVRPRLLAMEPTENVPTRGPVLLKFNTPLSPDSFRDNVRIEAEGEFKPLERTGEGKPYADYSSWEFHPRRPLSNGESYTVEIKGELCSQFGQKMGMDIKNKFSTAPELKITDMYPREGSPSVWLGRHVNITANQEIKRAEILVDDMPGRVIVSGSSATLVPDRTLLPNRLYKVRVDLTSGFGETLTREFSFHTTNLGREKWLEIKLDDPCKVWIMAGDREIRAMKGWLSLDREKIPRVTLYETDRSKDLPGPEQPPPWIRLNADILLHSLPGSNKDNHHQLGLPQSFGCIYLPREDINWLRANMPEKFMVVVH